MNSLLWKSKKRYLREEKKHKGIKAEKRNSVIEKRAREIKESSSKREIHNVAYVLVALELVSGKQIDEYPDFIFASSESEDEIKLLRTILDRITKIDSSEQAEQYCRYEEKTVIKFLKESRKGLEDKGLLIAKDQKKRIDCLVINTSRVKMNLLQTTEYRDLPIQDYLINLPGAYVKKHYLFGRKAIYYPWNKVMELYPDKPVDEE